ncbi:MAG: hypothetical protein NVV62_02660 [Terricaulis sp.]|nr:hypothetical protein [Terricaulis sp.]
MTGSAFASNGYDIVPERISTHTGEKDGADINTLTGVFDYALTDNVSLDLLLRRRDAQVEYDPGLFGNIDENLFTEIASESALWRPRRDMGPDRGGFTTLERRRTGNRP